MRSTETLTAAALKARLRERYARPEWAFFDEVRAGTGYDLLGSADGIAMNLWPSRGLVLHGFEVKVDRRDWVRELANPAKAETFARRVDYWWLVVSDPSIVKDGELPEGWGLLVPHGERLKVAREAAKRPTDAAIDRLFVAVLLRRAQEASTDDAALLEARRDARAEGVKAGRKEVEAGDKSRLQRVERERDEVLRAIDEFEAASGVQLSAWKAEKIGAAVRFVLDGGLAGVADKVAEIKKAAQRVVEVCAGVSAIAAATETPS